MTEVKEKAVLVTVGTIRVKEYDAQNVTLERSEEVFNPKDGETSTKWRFKGYFPTVFNALTFAVKKELLIDRNVVSDLKSYLKQVEDSNVLVLSALQPK